MNFARGLFLFLFFSSALARADLDPFFADPTPLKRKPAAEVALPEGFVVVAPERQPAAARKKKPVASTRRSRLPKTVNEGFELRVRFKKVTSLFWVVRQAEKFELIFANSAGSRLTLTLSADVYRQLLSAAESVSPAEKRIDGCAESSVQLHVLVSSGRGERTHTTCAGAKGADGDTIRALSQSLALMVR